MPYVVAYLGAIVAANLLVATFGPAIVIVNAFVFIGLDLTCRDKLHDAWHGRRLVVRMGLLIAAGGALSYLLNASAGPIAIASTVAFALASLADWATYALLGDRARMVRVNGSNVVGAAVDSVTFPVLAGFGTGPIIVGLFIAKVAGGFVWSLILPTPTPTPVPATTRTGWHRWDCPEIWGYGCACGGNEPVPDPEPWELEPQTRPDPEVDR